MESIVQTLGTIAQKDKRQSLLVCVLLVAVALTAYGRVLGLGFVNYDDPTYVAENRHVLGGLNGAGIAWAFTTTTANNWHPLTWLSLMLDATLAGPDPRMYHATNLLLHVVSVLLLFLVLSRMAHEERHAVGRVPRTPLRARSARSSQRASSGTSPLRGPAVGGDPRWKSAFVAALFAVHPLHVESVAWVAERKDVLSAFFWLLALAAYVRYVARPSAGRYVTVVVTFALGLMAKPMLVTLPFVLLLLDFWPLGRWPDRAVDGSPGLFLEKIPLFALAGASSIATLLAQGAALQPLGVLPLRERAANSLISYVAYIEKMLCPQRLAVFYPPPRGGLPLWEPTAAALLLVAVSVAAVLLARSRPWLPVGWFWYVVTLVPVIGLVQVGSQTMADRYTYVPLIGLFIVVAWGVPDFLGAHSRRESGRTPLTMHVLKAAAILVVLVLAACTWVQVGYWRSSADLYAHALEVTKENAIAHHNLATILYERGDLTGAVTHLREALRIVPGFTKAHFNLTRALMDQGNLEDAAALCREEKAAWPTDERTLVDLGLLARLQGKRDEAANWFSETIRLYPDSATAHLNLANIRAAQGRRQEANAHYSELVRIIGPEKARKMGWRSVPDAGSKGAR